MPTPDRLTIRPIELADVPALLTIIADARREYGIAGREVPLLEPSDYQIYSVYQRQRALYFVAVKDGEVVGGAGIAPFGGVDPLTCELQRMYLRPDARGRGIGEALLERCMAAARQFLYVRCYLETVSEMREAIGFYGRHGFQPLRAPLEHSVHAHNDHWMMRALRASARATLEAASARATSETASARAPEPPLARPAAAELPQAC